MRGWKRTQLHCTCVRQRLECFRLTFDWMLLNYELIGSVWPDLSLFWLSKSWRPTHRSVMFAQRWPPNSWTSIDRPTGRLYKRWRTIFLFDFARVPLQPSLRTRITHRQCGHTFFMLSPEPKISFTILAHHLNYYFLDHRFFVPFPSWLLSTSSASATFVLPFVLKCRRRRRQWWQLSRQNVCAFV